MLSKYPILNSIDDPEIRQTMIESLEDEQLRPTALRECFELLRFDLQSKVSALHNTPNLDDDEFVSLQIAIRILTKEIAALDGIIAKNDNLRANTQISSEIVANIVDQFEEVIFPSIDGEVISTQQAQVNSIRGQLTQVRKLLNGKNGKAAPITKQSAQELRMLMDDCIPSDVPPEHDEDTKLE